MTRTCLLADVHFLGAQSLLRKEYVLVSEKEWIDGSGEEEHAAQVDGGSGGDGHDGADRDGFLRVGQVAGTV